MTADSDHNQPGDTGPRDPQQISAIPARYLSLTRDDVLRVAHSLPPVQRAQFAVAFRAAEAFIANPHGSLVLVGAVGTGRTMLAAYIAGHLAQPGVFLPLRRLIDLLSAMPEGVERDLLYRAPVLIVDDFAATWVELSAPALQQLQDLIAYRQGNALPFVVTSHVDLRELSAAHSPILDMLQRDAEVYVFDHVPSPPGSSARQAVTPQRPPLPVEPRYCSFLGAEDRTGAVLLPRNVCLRPAVPQPIKLTYQASTCLTANHAGCAVFQVPADQPVAALPPDILDDEPPPLRIEPPNRRWLLPVLAAILCGLLLGAFALFSRQVVGFMGSALAGGGAPSGYHSPPTRTPTPTITPTVTPLPPTAFPTPAPPATPRIVGQVTLSYESHLRALPDAGAAALSILPAGMVINVLGRDNPGEWLFVATLDGQTGWVATTQFDALPFVVVDVPVTGIGTQPVSSGPGPAVPDTPLTAFPSPVPTPELPGTFVVLIDATDISNCAGYSGFTATYTFNLNDRRISLLRQIDGTLLLGTYDPVTASFDVSAARATTSEDITGTITVQGDLIVISGEQRVTFYDGTCPGDLSIEGSVTLPGR